MSHRTWSILCQEGCLPPFTVGQRIGFCFTDDYDGEIADESIRRRLAGSLRGERAFPADSTYIQPILLCAVVLSENGELTVARRFTRFSEAALECGITETQVQQLVGIAGTTAIV